MFMRPDLDRRLLRDECVIYFLRMKKDIHPENYRDVIFLDTTSGEKFLVASTVETEDTDTYEGDEYPLYRIEMSSASHPFYTGVEQVVDTAGRVEKFQRRQQARQESQSTKNGSSNDGTGDEQNDTPESKDFEDVKAEMEEEASAQS